MIEHYRNHRNFKPATQDEATQTCGQASHATPFDPIKHALEKRLVKRLPDLDHPNDSLTEAMHHAVLEAGNRRCPRLFMSIAHDPGHDAPFLPDIASAIELVHAASFILADLPCKDDRKLRHGQPAVHGKFGEDVAMLAAVAVALVSHAFHIAACAEAISPNARLRLTSVLAPAAGTHGSARGQP